MFDSLLGKKFSNKCKHSIKCINTRILPIRRKKQAMLRILKRDIADLVAKGDEVRAFGRAWIEALIIDINHTSCYDMVEQYCGCILKLLPVLQKQRECPEDATEAVSTLIFAAARFPDLPELCDLRRAFTERYGGHLEASVNKEFVDRIQNKSFSTDKKLQLMQEIAQEFSVTWDFHTFELKIYSSTSLDQPKRRESIRGGNNKAPHESNGKKETDAKESNQEIPYNERYRAAPMTSISQKQVQPEPRDIHVVSSIENSLSQKTRKIPPFEPEDVGPNTFVKLKCSRNGSQKDDQQSRSRSPWAKEEPESATTEKSSDDQRAAYKVPPPYTKPKGIKTELETNDTTTKNSIDDQRAAYKVPPPYTKPKGIKTELETNDASPKDLREGLNSTISERQPIRPVCMIPPYVKPNVYLAEDKDSQKTGLVDAEKPRPVSVRRKHTKLPSAIENGNATDDADAERARQNPGIRRREGNHNKVDEIQDCGMKLPVRKVSDDLDDDRDRHTNQTPGGRRRHEIRRTSRTKYEGEEDEEEKDMDRLLVLYSNKGMEGSLKHTERAVSLPIEPSRPSDGEIAKGPTRAASMLPDYDELAARFIALRKA